MVNIVNREIFNVAEITIVTSQTMITESIEQVKMYINRQKPEKTSREGKS
jgi:hypothetical protein